MGSYLLVLRQATQICIPQSRPHAHLKGREIYTSIIRDGKEVDFLANNTYFDFNYQYYNFLRNPVKLKQVSFSKDQSSLKLAKDF